MSLSFVTSADFQEPRTYAAIGFWVASILIITIFLTSFPVQAQTKSDATPTVQGQVRDSSGKACSDATVFLEKALPQTPPVTDKRSSAAAIETTHTDSKGRFSFSGVIDGSYTLRAEAKEAGRSAASSVRVSNGRTNTVDLVLTGTSASNATKAPEFFDEPRFTVAGVTQSANYGGHGSDTKLRTSEELVKATASLGNGTGAAESSENETLQRERAAIRAQLLDTTKGHETIEQQADLHSQLGHIEEHLGNPLEAVHEYQRAAELNPSEAFLFDWASELLTHRASEPAAEVFAKGNHIYPRSVRMLIGMGVAAYAGGAYDQAAHCLAEASDLAPRDPAPYQFMGKMLSAEIAPSEQTVERLARFQRLEPNNALANYYYAVSFWKEKQAADALDDTSFAQVELLLENAVRLDPKLGAAHLQLGVLYAQRGEYEKAIPAYKRATEVSPELEEAHYRLAQAYRHTGDALKAKEEIQLQQQLSKQSKEQAERERSEIQQFVVTLRDKEPGSN